MGSVACLLLGLSPRVRGNQKALNGPIRASRSIPACAGEPPAQARRPTGGPAVYPRVCGGTPNVPNPALAAVGLSPRVRGNLVILRSRSGLMRSIPACAGEP